LFLSLGRDVYGVELAPSRWQLADEALRKLVAAAPSRFRYESLGEASSRPAACSAAVWRRFIFNRFLRLSHREPRNRGEGEGLGWRGSINFGPKSEASLWGRGGFINRRSPVPISIPY
jgi:hypothetical protein